MSVPDSRPESVAESWRNGAATALGRPFATPTFRSAGPTSARTAATAAALTATLGLAAASWVVAVRQMNGMDMGVATRLGSFAFFVALWVCDDGGDDAAGRGSGGSETRSVPAVVCAPCRCSSGRTSPSGRSWASPCTRCTGRTGRRRRARWRSRPGVYELTPLKQHFRRRCRESVALWIRVRALLRRLEHRTDADAGGAERHERHLDGR